MPRKPKRVMSKQNLIFFKMKNSKKQKEFSKILELNKEDIAILSDNDKNVIRGGAVLSEGLHTCNDCNTKLNIDTAPIDPRCLDI